jgi:(2R)-sulfolactate sulfo-lyase subunit alpha
MHDILAHHAGDSVGVAIRDIKTGEQVLCVYLNGESIPRFRALDDVPLGHKIALTAIAAGEKVVKYGEQIGLATTQIEKGQHVHLQNLKSARWSLSAR